MIYSNYTAQQKRLSANTYWKPWDRTLALSLKGFSKNLSNGQPNIIAGQTAETHYGFRGFGLL